MLPGNFFLLEEVSVRIAYRNFSLDIAIIYDNTNVICSFN